MPKIIKNKSNKVKKNYNPVIAYLISIGKGLSVSLIGLILIAYALTQNAKINSIFIILIYIVVSIGSFISGYFAYKMLKQKGVVNGCVSGVIFSLIMIMFCSIILYFNISLKILLVVPICIVFGCLGGIIGANKK